MIVNTLKLTGDILPLPLTYLPQPPRQIYIEGAGYEEWADKPKLAVVGSRKASRYGRAATEKLAAAASRAGVVIISGLALGIDSIAHQACINAGGQTVAVLPAALDNIYPASHYGLSRQILQSGGSLVSEYPEGSEIYKTSFIARNRIMAALADCVLITEAALKSGSLHTARFALELGKSVLAVPGNIDQPGSEGCNNLIKSGATPITNETELLFALGVPLPKQTKLLAIAGLSKDEQAVVEALRGGISDQQLIAQACQLPPAQFYSLLTQLEIKGHIKPLGAGHWTLAA